MSFNRRGRHSAAKKHDCTDPVLKASQAVERGVDDAVRKRQKEIAWRDHCGLPTRNDGDAVANPALADALKKAGIVT